MFILECRHGGGGDIRFRAKYETILMYLGVVISREARKQNIFDVFWGLFRAKRENFLLSVSSRRVLNYIFQKTIILSLRYIDFVPFGLS